MGLVLFFQSPGALRTGGLLFRMTLLALGGAGVLYVRWKIMGTGPPAFTEVDNPASFADSMLVRVSPGSVLHWALFAHQIPRSSLPPPPRLPPQHTNEIPVNQNTSTGISVHRGSSGVKPGFYQGFERA